MSFANIALLFGAVAFVAPLLIHLLNRSRFQTVDWGAMHLLDEALQVNSRRLQWESWLLLLIRCLIPIILAVCLARPVLTALQIAGARNPQSIAFILDDTLSMQATETGTSRFAEAQQAIQTIADQSALYRRSEKTLITLGGQPTELNGITTDNVRLTQALRQLAPQAGSNQPPQALLEAAKLLESSSHPNRQVILVSDFRRSDWSSVTPQELEQIRQLLQSSSANDSTRLSILNVGREDQDNVAVEFAALEDFRMLPDLPKPFRLRVSNYGQTTYEGRIEFAVEGQRIASQVVSLDAGASSDVFFACQFPESGWYTLTAKLIDAEDALNADNVAHLVVRVVPPQQVLLISEDGPSEDFNPETGFLKLALAPFDQDSKAAGSRGRQKLSPNLFELRHVASSRLRAEDFEGGYAAVVLAGISRLRDSHVEALTEYVEQGGGLLFFPGAELRADWVEQKMVQSVGLLPRSYGDLKRENTKLLQEQLTFPPLQVFNSGEAGDLSELEIQCWHPLQPAKEQNSEEAVGESAQDELIALRAQDGSPLLVARPFGQGQVLQMALSCSDEWSNLPLRPAFVPLIQRLVFSIGNAGVSPNVRASETAYLNIPNWPQSQQLSIASKWQADALDSATASDQNDYPLQDSEQAFPHTARPGIYLLNIVGGDPDANRESDTTSSPILVPPRLSVQVDPNESDLRRLDEVDIQRVADALGARLLNSAEEFQSTSKLNETGHEIWRWFLVALLVLLFAEILLGKAITKGSIG